MEINVHKIEETEDPYLVLNAEKHEIPASLKITLHFEGDWSNIYDDVDESEEDARAAVAANLFELVLAQFE